MIISDEARRLKTEDPAVFCELLALHEETERHGKAICEIFKALEISDKH